MNLRLVPFAILLALLLPPLLPAGENSTVKCTVNEDRVWVYDSPATLNVAAKLKCGAAVTVLSRENGYTKVQAADGTEGYIPDDNLPKTAVPTAAAQPNAPVSPSLASVARAANARRSTIVASAGPRVGSSTAHPAAPAKTASARAPKSENTMVAAASTPSANVAKAAPSVAPTTAPAASVRASEGSPISTSRSSHAKSKQLAKSSSSAVATVKPNVSSRPAAAPRPADSPVSHAAATTNSPTTPLAAENVDDGRVDSTPTITPATKTAAVRNVADTSSDEEGDDESYLVRPTSESEDPACRLFFSGYGLSPGQFKWMVDNRKKEFPSVCPAATPSMVDYVVIFTHDADSFSYNMPEPVHTAGGFSDWNPIVQYDMSRVPRSQIDRSKREYVWVFHVKRGTYEPSRFSPHRRFQFNKIESKYSRTVKDALEFIETQGVNR